MKKISLMILCMMLSLSLVGCGSKTNKEVSFEEIANTITKKIESGDIAMGMGMTLDETSIKDLYDIDPNDLESFHVVIPVMNVQASEYAMFKAKDGKLDAVKKGVEHRIETLKQTWSQYLPEQYEFVKNYKTYESGNYYFMVINENPDNVLNVIKDAFK